MSCTQDTIPRFSVLEWPGAASDAAFDLLKSVVGRQLHIAAGGSRSCCGVPFDLVAAEATDPSLPESARVVIGRLAPGHAVAALELSELTPGWIAMPGVDIRINAQADLGGAAVAITFDDALALLAAPGAVHLDVRTTATVSGTQETPPPGWRMVNAGVATVPLGNPDHLVGCGA